MRITLYVIHCISLCWNFSLYLILVSVTDICLDVFLLGLYPLGTPYTSWLRWLFPFSMIAKFSTMISSNIFFFFLFLWSLYLNVGALNVVPEVSETILISFNLFSLLCSVAEISTVLFSRSLSSSSVLIFLLLIPSRVFSLCYSVHFSVCSFVLSMSLLTFSFYLLDPCVLVVSDSFWPHVL